jgi:hypothetical protein
MAGGAKLEQQRSAFGEEASAAQAQRKAQLAALQLEAGVGGQALQCSQTALLRLQVGGLRCAAPAVGVN